MSKNTYELPASIERYLAALSKLYAQKGQRQKQEIIVNSRVRVDTEVSFCGRGDEYAIGHTLYLIIPDDLFVALINLKNDIENQLKDDINNIIYNINELVENVVLEMEILEDQDWRKKTGLLVAREHIIPPEAIKRIWEPDNFRVFFSHKANVKREVANLKSQLRMFGISGFVAHEDIQPTQEWQIEIENALASMDAFVALLTDNFHEKGWTDHEVGLAVGRKVPLIAIKLGMDPYGFIGKFQALSCDWATAAKEIVKLLVNFPRMLDTYIVAVHNCPNYEAGNTLSEILPSISKITDEQAQKLVSAFNENGQISNSFGFNGIKPSRHGMGLAAHLFRITGRRFEMTSTGRMQAIP